MIAARKRALVLIAVIMLGAGALAFANMKLAPAPPREKARLLLLTSLPLMFAEEFSLEQNGSPALNALEARYRIVPISATDGADLAKGRLLLMAHPLAQTADNLVTLDQWVRRGGRVLLLADPQLEWASGRPLGDPLRAAPMFMDTGLLAHWGLRLDPPAERGPKQLELGGYDIVAASPGTLHGSCVITKNRLLAECAIGKGRAMVVADADLLAVDQLDGPTERNLDAVLDLLARLERRVGARGR